MSQTDIDYPASTALVTGGTSGIPRSSLPVDIPLHAARVRTLRRLPRNSASRTQNIVTKPAA